MKKNGFIISTTIYGIFGIMLLTVFYILYIISNNRYLITTNINDIKSSLKTIDNNSTISGIIETPDGYEANTTLYIDESGANYPKLAKGMIPVIYDSTNDVWIKADLTTKWYDYNTQMWANAVTVTNTNRDTYLSDDYTGEIPMSEINSMWVWIPRFKYKIIQNMGSDSNITSPPQIDVIFERNLNTTGVSEQKYREEITRSGLNINYYTHPSFRDQSSIKYSSKTTSRGAWDREILGFWAGKFETGGSSSNPLIKPDITSLYHKLLSNQFVASLKFAGGEIDADGLITFSGNDTYGFSNSVDTHMMKNTEWGAVAILSQSKYGKNGNSSYTSTSKQIYVNNSSSYYTGRSLGTYQGNYKSYGTYSYNDKACSSTTCTGTKTTNAGQGASTTGNIYGIYDMSGGTYENVMSMYNKKVGYSTTGLSGFNGTYCTNTKCTTTNSYSSGTAIPAESKYYDNYKGTEEKSISIMGDATWETMGWYSDTGSGKFVENRYPFFFRGGTADNLSTSTSKNIGIYAFESHNCSTGSSPPDQTFRTVLMP